MAEWTAERVGIAPAVELDARRKLLGSAQDIRHYTGSRLPDYRQLPDNAYPAYCKMHVDLEAVVEHSGHSSFVTRHGKEYCIFFIRLGNRMVSNDHET
jgi:hypothetical protein